MYEPVHEAFVWVYGNGRRSPKNIIEGSVFIVDPTTTIYKIYSKLTINTTEQHH